ncbi:radical SAM protein [Rhizobium leguminosarum]|nr:radical SAM protein [Rhizobium leguminosarum]
MTTPISKVEFEQLHSTMQDVVHYRKSGLSLNHVVGCPLECAYCIRHSVGAYDLKQPRTMMSDEEAVQRLVSDPYFQRDLTPIQLFNKATDPFLPGVKPHTFNTVRLLDEMGLKNNLLIITRYRVTEEDCSYLNQVKNLKLTLFVTYSGIDNKKIEPISNRIPAESLQVLYKNARAYRVVLYWRPLVPGLNDSAAHIAKAVALSKHAHATAFTGLFYRQEMKQYFLDMGLPDLSEGVARRKILPEMLEQQVLDLWKEHWGDQTLFRKTSCAVAYAHSIPDYNGHFGVRELCDICPQAQYGICEGAHKQPSEANVRALLKKIDREDAPFEILANAVSTVGLDEPPRYYLQHGLGFQVHDKQYPHKFRQHGRADIGWSKVEN